MFRDNSPDELLSGLVLVAPSREHIDALYDALGLLAAISPFLLHDVSMNVRHLCLIEPGAEPTRSGISGMPMSMTYHGFPGCAFLSPGAFGSIPLLAELIYHEALHIKLTNLIALQPIYRSGYTAMPGHHFPCPWISPDAGKEHLWPFDRAFAAFHVYVHLHVLYGALLQSPWLVPGERALDRRRTAETKGTILRSWVAGKHITL